MQIYIAQRPLKRRSFEPYILQLINCVYLLREMESLNPWKNPPDIAYFAFLFAYQNGQLSCKVKRQYFHVDVNSRFSDIVVARDSF